MLQIKNIVKDYGDKENVVHALKGINLNFRDCELVSILGQSGCGKTTLLNIIGGLDRYTSGDLLIDGVSTKDYKDVDWDTYRNIRIGFIFQSYNLIMHTDIVSNVEMSLTLAGVSAKERRERAIKALEEVGLKDQMYKKPNQLSGGQMQRVSIARALINNPEILLADEPTGALDSNTSIQIMDMIKQIAKDRLVIMVTHNPELAEQYSTRIVKLSDGEVISDSNPYVIEDVKDEIIDEGQVSETEKTEQVKTKKQERQEIKAKKKKLATTAMSFWTALKLSFRNLMTKKTRTVLTAVAGSIGIIGLSLVLAISNGFNSYVKSMETDMMSGYPVTIQQSGTDMSTMMQVFMGGNSESSSSTKNPFPTTGKVYPAKMMDKLKEMAGNFTKQNISEEYIEYLNNMDESYYGAIHYSYGMKLNIIGKPLVSTFTTAQKAINLVSPGYGSIAYYGTEEEYQNITNMSGMVSINELTGNKDFILSQYELLYGEYPQNKNQAVLVVSTENKIDEFTLAALGVPSTTSYTFEEIITKIGQNKIKVYDNDNYYYEDASSTAEKRYFKAKTATELYTNDSIQYEELQVVGVLRARQDVSYATLMSGLCYTSELVEYMLEKNVNSKIVEAQKNSPKQYVLQQKEGFPATFADSIGSMFSGEMAIDSKESALQVLGGDKTPVVIAIYPTDFENKEKITAYLDAWNNNPNTTKENRVKYTDMASIIASMLSEMIKIVTIALTCFSAVSLFVSSFMIGIITYVSVVERTKEIGILRSLGARKKDIARVFNAETLIIGGIAGLFGVIITYILSVPINILVNYKAGMVLNLCSLNPLTALAMIALSMLLTLIAGLIPASYAANKDPVVALRTE